MEFIDYNCHHKLTYEARMGKIMAFEASTLAIGHTKIFTVETLHQYDSSSTVAMCNHEYDKW